MTLVALGVFADGVAVVVELVDGPTAAVGDGLVAFDAGAEPVVGVAEPPEDDTCPVEVVDVADPDGVVIGVEPAPAPPATGADAPPGADPDVVGSTEPGAVDGPDGLGAPDVLGAGEVGAGVEVVDESTGVVAVAPDPADESTDDPPPAAVLDDAGSADDDAVVESVSVDELVEPPAAAPVRVSAPASAQCPAKSAAPKPIATAPVFIHTGTS